MIAAGHTSIGVIIAVVITRVFPGWSLWHQALLVLVLAFISHYLTDFIPHGHYHRDLSRPTWWEKLAIGSDLVGFAVLLAGLMVMRHGIGSELLLIITGVIGAQLTDVWDWVIVARGWVPLRGWVAQHRRFHHLIHWHDVYDNQNHRKARPIGWWDAWQVAVIALAIYLVVT